jgi:hypothetical protein
MACPVSGLDPQLLEFVTMADIIKFGAHVATYQDIVSHFAQYKRARQAHIDALKNTIIDLSVHYEKTLQLAKNTWASSDANRKPYMQVGHIQDGRFVPKLPQILEEGGTAPIAKFVIALEIQLHPGVMPEEKAQVALTLSMVENAYHLTVGRQGLAVEIPMDGDDSRFDAACAAITQNIMGTFKLTDFPLEARPAGH